MFSSLLPVLSWSLMGSLVLRVSAQNVSFTPDIVLDVTLENITQACVPKQAVVVNGTTPGPQIGLKEGVTSWVRVYNNILSENLTVHWHGLNIKPSSDGTPVSQWPIESGHYWDYEIKPENGSAGSYFYHSHVRGMQAVTANGPLIVADAGPPPYQYVADKTIYLTDQYKETDEQIEQGLLANPFNWSGEVSNLLINGNGVKVNTTQAGPFCTLDTSLVLEPDQTYRVRFISGSALSFVTIGIQGHDNVSVIEADGAYTEPYSTNNIQLGGGQRYSVLLKSKTAASIAADRAAGINKYYIQMETLDRPAVFYAYAVITYVDPSNATISPGYQLPPPTPPLMLPNTSLVDMPLAALHPATDFPTRAEVTRTVIIDVEQLVSGNIIWVENGRPWTEVLDPYPYLVAIYNGDYSQLPSYEAATGPGGTGMDNRTSTFPAKVGEVLEIVWQNKGNNATGGLDSHPFHAHGAHYWDLGSGNGSYSAAVVDAQLGGRQPVKRDTTMLFRYEEMTTANLDAGWRAWRIRVDSPGVWPIHCHTLQHMIMGMQTVWVFGSPEDILALPRPNLAGYGDYGDDVTATVNYSPGYSS